MKKTTYDLATATNSTLTRNLESKQTAKVIKLESALPIPPSEETIARLNAIGREYPFCAYMKQNSPILL
jgi:hypothetical protein